MFGTRDGIVADLDGVAFAAVGSFNCFNGASNPPVAARVPFLACSGDCFSTLENAARIGF
jgi:hypothetical protein